jgi:hypothetical protein
MKPKAHTYALPCTPVAFLATAIALALSSVFAAAAGADATGAATFLQPPVTAPGGAFAGKATTVNGHVDSGAGQVSIDAKLGAADWSPVASAQADAQGDFSITWTPPKAGRYDFRITPTAAAAITSNEADGALSVYRRQKATWYGPGSYGSRTACGQRLTRRTLGVAHRTLPCGTKVELYLSGKKLVVPVIDRGPFVRGVTWDLTLATAKRLGTPDTVILGALALR